MSKPLEGYKRVQANVSEECFELLKVLKKEESKSIGEIIEEALQNEYYFKRGI